ncbi:hypothetical protein GIB67_003428 [Kingdonia uniflora]|uniref:Uncharacterized protein n=1 Tax=Kingdonia uniflora TaxID=39325 RepID=A0A7J7P9C2_9MAGN|nr:hypothetical protein GIB67_003428 [Kingdonia uniflora]
MGDVFDGFGDDIPIGDRVGDGLGDDIPIESTFNDGVCDGLYDGLDDGLCDDIPIESTFNDYPTEIDPDNLVTEEGYYYSHTSLDGNEEPTQEDIDKCDKELRNFAKETENNFGVVENATVTDNPFQKVLYHEIKNKSYRIRLEYSKRREEGSKWLFYARVTPDGHTFKLRKSSMLIHTCKGKGKSISKLVHARWVANEAGNIMITIRSIKPCGVIELIRVNYGIDISDYTVRNAWNIRMERIMGSYDEGHVLQPELCRQILSSNPGSMARTSKVIDTNQWTGTCVAYKASLDGFGDGCRPILGLDVCFLKGKFGGGHYHPEGATDGYFVAIGVNGHRWMVHTKKHVCDFNEWQLTGLPYAHAVDPCFDVNAGSAGRSTNRARGRNGAGVHYNSYGGTITIGFDYFGGGTVVRGRARGGLAERNVGGT